MLSMKTLRVAIVTVVSALMLGSGLVAAQRTIELDGTAAAMSAPTPVRLAAESIETEYKPGATVLGYAVNVGSVNVGASARATIPAGYFIRVKLNGAVFRADPTTTTGVGEIAQGGAGTDQVVFPVAGENGIARRPAEGGPVSVTVTISDILAVTSASPGTVTASMEAYKDQFDAINGTGALSSQYFGGSATIIQKVSGITAQVKAGTTATADAAVGFRWFVSGGNNTPSVTLGSFTVTENGSESAIDQQTIDAGTGAVLVANSLIAASTGAHLRIDGELGIGAFRLVRQDPDTPAVESCVRNPDDGYGSAEAPLLGNVRATEEMPNTATVSTGEGADATNSVFGSGGSQGTYTLCVTVDTMGEMSNMTALPETEFMGTILRPIAGTPTSAPTSRELASGVVGKIMRNGASVKIAFLTNAEKYNQRLIIVNHGSRDIAITDFEPNVEADVEVELMSGAEDLMIAAGERKVYLVKDMLSIMGRNRVAGMLSFNGVKGDISVATTLVNREDGSTDTVMWPVN